MTDRPIYSPEKSPPLSPHLQVWKFTVTMAASITHRATGMAQFFGGILVALWLVTAALGEGAYTAFQGFMGSWFGQLILIGYTWSLSFHLLNGLRYLGWDAGVGFEKATAIRTGWLAFAGSIVLTAIIWTVSMVARAGA